MMRNRLIILSVTALLAFNTEGNTQATLQPEPISNHYRDLGKISDAPDNKRRAMDTISFPWNEYSRGALSNSLMRTIYLNTEDEAKLPTLISYPANSSEQTRAELDYLLQLQYTRTGEQIKKAEYIAQIGSSPSIINPTDSEYSVNIQHLFYIAGNVGKWYNAENFPATTRLLLNTIQDIRVTEFRLKRFFKRARPYHLEPLLKPLARINSPSFASGHTLWAFTQAYIFGEIIPDKRIQFIERAEEVRWSRELMGIHYPSDNEASRIIAWQLLKAWFKNPLFVSDLEQAKIEWSRKKDMYR